MTEQIAKEKRSKTHGDRPVKVTSPSKKLLKLLDSLIPDFKKLQVKVDAIFKQARAEGFPDEETGAMIRMRMDGNYSERTIRRVLPDEAKHTEFDSSKNKNNDKEPDILSGSEQETETTTTNEQNDAKIAEIDKKYVGAISDVVAEEEILQQIQQDVSNSTVTTRPEIFKEISETDSHRFCKETIATKIKLIEELREELAAKDKKIVELQKEIAELKKGKDE